MDLTTNPPALQAGADAMQRGRAPLAEAVTRALRAAAAAAGDPRLEASVLRAAQGWGRALAALETDTLAGTVRRAASTYAEAEASVLRTVRRP